MAVKPPNLQPIELKEGGTPQVGRIEITERETPSIIESGFELEEGSFKILDTHSMPPFPAKTIRADKDRLFFDWIASLKDEDWDHLQCYLYREWPIIDRKQVQPNNSTNIDKLTGKFDKDFIKQEHGSGKYMFMINDVNKAVKGKGGSLGTAHTDIDDPNHPPKFILEELVTEHPSNRRVRDKLISEGKLTIEGRPMVAQGGSDNAALIGLLAQVIRDRNAQVPTKDNASDNVAAMFKSTHEATIGMLKDQMKSDDPDKWIKIMALVKDMMPKSDSGNEMLTVVMKMQTDMAKVQSDAQASREAMMLKMMEMMNQKKEETDTFDMQLDRMIKMKEFMGENGGGGGKKNTTLETVLEYGSPVAMKLMDTIMGFVNVKNAVDGLKRQQAQQAQQQPEPQGIPAPLPEPPTEQKENVVEMPAQGIPFAFLLKNGAGAMIISSMQRGITGDQFAESIEVQHGRLEYEKISLLGKEKILSEMQAVPEFWAQVVPSSIEKFVDEFIAYGSEEEGEEGEKE